jgi:hypothetical protein
MSSQVYEGWVWDGTKFVSIGPLLSGPSLPTGGSLGQLLRKASGTNFDVEWATVSTAVVYDGGGPETDFSVGVNINCGGVT